MAKQEGEAMGYPVYHHHGYTELPAAASPVLVVLPRRERSNCKSILLVVSIFLLLGLGAFMLWPFQVDVQVRRTKLLSMSWDSGNAENGMLAVGLNMKFQLQLRVRNPNVYGLRIDRLVVDIVYRGDKLGRLVLDAGHIPAFSVVNLDATMDLKGLKVLENAVQLLLDISEGRLPLETLTHLTGNLEAFGLEPHVEVKVSCDTVVNPNTQEIISQHCLLAE